MNEHPEHDANLSRAHLVGQFRRVARLAAADPLRLLPLDPLAWLQSLSAPAAELIDLAPLERLRQAITAPVAQPRAAVTRSRVRPFVQDAGSMQPRAAGVPPAAARESGPQEVATSPRHRTPASHAREMSSGDDRPRHEAQVPLTLAERRAALRRTIGESDVPAGLLSSSATEARLATGARRTPSNEDPHARAPLARASGTLADAAPHAPADDLEPSLISREAQDARSEEQPVDVPRGTSENSLLLDEPQPTPAQRNAVAVTPGAPHDSAPIYDAPPAEWQRGFLATALESPATASRVAGAIPPGDRVAVPAETGPARRRPDRHTTTQIDLADALFDTLYRSGVDLPWP
jgi:hypothetical protein